MSLHKSQKLQSESESPNWNEWPALLAGISLWMGIGTSLFSFPIYLFFALLAYLLWTRRWSGIAMLVGGFVYTQAIYAPSPTLLKPTACQGYFSLSSLQKEHSPFHEKLLYRGTLYVDGTPLTCAVSLPSQSERLTADQDYILKGTLAQRGPFDYFLKSTEWAAVPHTWSLAELRFQTKERFRKWLDEKLEHPRTASLLSSLATGEIEERLLRYEFGRLGLQHLLAISGFHFGVLVAFLSLLLGLFLPPRPKWIVLLCLAFFYYLFIGSAASVQRAWIVVALFLLGKILRKSSDPINLLGAALLMELLLNPLRIATLAFQLSFASSFGILFFHRWFQERLFLFLPKRTWRESIALKPLSQLFYLLCTFLRQGMSLSLAVNVMILPLLLYHFGKFPCLSLLYNLFYPFLIGILLIALLSVLFFSLVAAPLSPFLFRLLDAYTKELLELSSYPPLLLDVSFYLHLPAWGLILYYGCLLFWMRNRKIA
jgi:competence protein ComEC